MIFQKRPGLILVVEVKTVSRFEFLAYRIGRRQKERLYRACEYLRGRSRQDVELNWAFVTEHGEVLVIDEVRG